MRADSCLPLLGDCLNESPSEKEGKLAGMAGVAVGAVGLNESPSEKEGKSAGVLQDVFRWQLLPQ